MIEIVIGAAVVVLMVKIADFEDESMLIWGGRSSSRRLAGLNSNPFLQAKPPPRETLRPAVTGGTFWRTLIVEDR